MITPAGMAVPMHPLALVEPPRIHWIGSGIHAPGDSRWRLPGLWCVHAYDYVGEIRLDGVLLPIRPRSVGVSPAGADMQYRFFTPSFHLCAHFRPAPGRAERLLPAMQDLGDGYAEVDLGLRLAVSWHATEPRRAEARLWDLLWSLSRPAAAAPHPLIERARREIELRLGGPIAISGLARQLGVSHNHLIRLFRSELGTSPAAWIRRRRAQRARHLLERTNMPVSAVAAEVGILDPQQFNKLIRRELGASPRAVRALG